MNANPRVDAWMKATGDTEFNGYAFRRWLDKKMHEAADQNRGVFKFDGSDVPHIHDHAEYDRFLHDG